jgi:hypothetical protein
MFNFCILFLKFSFNFFVRFVNNSVLHHLHCVWHWLNFK